MKEKPSWKYRRRVIFGTLIFNAAIVLYVLMRWDSTSLAETAILSAFGLAGAIIASYIGGAAYEDGNLYKGSLSIKGMSKNESEKIDEDV